MTPREPQPPDNNDLEEIDGPQDQDPTPGRSSRKPGSWIHRVGLTGLIAGTAALITAVAALINALDSRHGHAPDAPPNNAAAAPFNISDYWYGTPANASQPLVFHLMVNEPPASRETQLDATQRDATDAALSSVLGTMRNPCQGDSILKIESGTWNGGHLIVHVSAGEGGKPLTLDVFREASEPPQLSGTLTEPDTEAPITLHRGETNCPR